MSTHTEGGPQGDRHRRETRSMPARKGTTCVNTHTENGPQGVRQVWTFQEVNDMELDTQVHAPLYGASSMVGMQAATILAARLQISVAMAASRRRRITAQLVKPRRLATRLHNCDKNLVTSP